MCSLTTCSCSAATFCLLDPPPKPEYGVRIWNGHHFYQSKASYNCGPFGEFRMGPGEPPRDEIVSTCLWEMVWDVSAIPECKCERRITDFGRVYSHNGVDWIFFIAATHCTFLPVPPPETGLVLSKKTDREKYPILFSSNETILRY